MITTDGIIPQNAKDNSVDPVVCTIGEGCKDVEMVGSWDSNSHPVLYYNQPFDFPQTVTRLILERSTDLQNWDLIGDTDNATLPTPNTSIPLIYSFADTDITLFPGQVYYYRMTGIAFAGNFSYNVVSINLANDIQSPRVQILSPYDGATVSGSIPVLVNAEDDINMARVDIYVSDRGVNNLVGSIALFGTNTSGSLTVDTTPYTNGAHAIAAIPYDAAGNRGMYALISVNILNGSTDAGIVIFAKDVGKSVLVPFQGPVCKIVGVKFDSAGNMVMVGNFMGTINFLGVQKTSVDPGAFDIVVMQVSPAGALNWIFTYGSQYDDLVGGVALDSADNIYITGQHLGTINFGGSDIVSGGGTTLPDIFLAKFGSNGHHLWSKGFGGIGGNAGNNLCLDSSDNIYVVGKVNFTADFGGGPRTNHGDNGFVAKYLGSDGSWVWDRIFVGNANYSAGVVSNASSVFVVGYIISGNLDLGGGTITGSGYQCGFVGSYSKADGSFNWGHLHSGDQSNIVALCCAVDGIGNLYVGGTYSKQFSIDSITFSETGIYCYVVKLNPATGVAVAGVVVLSGTSIDPVTGIPFGILVDTTGMIVVGGVFHGNAFIAKYTPGMLMQWYYTYSPSTIRGNLGQAVAVNGTRQIAFVGFFTGSITIGSTTLDSSGFTDGFLAKYNP